jgi:hypothetical protein
MNQFSEGRSENSDPFPDPFSDPLTPRPLPNQINHMEFELDGSEELNSPTLPPLQFTTPLEPTARAIEVSSDPLGHLSPLFSQFANTAETHRFQKRKSPPTEAQQLPRTFPTDNLPGNTGNLPITAREAILQARDLIIVAYSKTTREEQTKLLDLLEIFREFTESGKITKTSNIIASQIANLETVTRKIESKTRNLVNNTKSTSNQPINQPTNQPIGQSFAQIASSTIVDNSKPQEWTIVGKKSKIIPKPATKPKEAKNTRRLILTRLITRNDAFSPLALRNAFNKAFSEKGIKNLVVASVTKSRNSNLVITTTSDFTAEFLLQKRSIWENLISFNNAQKDEPWHKVVVHGIPTMDFHIENGPELILEEIKTFNKGFNPIGKPYWLTSPEKRMNQIAGSMVISFSSEEEAKKAIRNRLYIAGLSVRVVKFTSTAPTTQCNKCQSFGHIDQNCKKSAKCGLCSENHTTIQHYCNICKTKGKKCIHLEPKCANCKLPHLANDKTCEVLIAIKGLNSSINE